MVKRVYRLLLNHIVCNIGIYSICIIFLVLGIVVGAIYGAGFENNDYFSGFFSGLAEYSASDFVEEGLAVSAVSALIIFVCGISPIGCVVLPVMLGYKGFVTGYTVSAFFCVYGLKAFVLIVIAIIPSAFFWIPAYLYCCVNGVTTSCYFLRILRRRGVNDISAKVGELGISCLIFLFCNVLSKFTEIFVIPQMLNLVGGLYT